jgi:hypothetical protein
MMKEQKPPDGPESAEPDRLRLREGPARKDVPELAEEREARANATAHRSSRPQPTMQNNKMHTQKTRGRLNRDTMKLLGKVLGDYFDHVRQQEVPEHITNLVKRFEERNDKGSN